MLIRSEIERLRREEVAREKVRQLEALPRRLGREATAAERRDVEKRIERARERMDRANVS